MAPRPTWEGHLRLSLVTCPVRLFKATGEGEAVHFHLLHRQTRNRVKQQYKDPEDGVVERRDLVRGYAADLHLDSPSLGCVSGRRIAPPISLTPAAGPWMPS